MKAVTRKLFEDFAKDALLVMFQPLKGAPIDGGGEDGRGWAYADVSIDNTESAGVPRGGGGQVEWTIRWVSVDLERVAMVLGRG